MSKHLKKGENLESNSNSGESNDCVSVVDELENEVVQKKKKNAKQRRNSEWEILESLREGQIYEIKPKKYEGFILKKRKWPLKGWHKRYFMLEDGFLKYAKNSSEMRRRKQISTIDVGISVISTQPELQHIDIDSEDFIHHFKVTSPEQFGFLIEQLHQHRLFRQNQINIAKTKGSKATSPLSPEEPLMLSPRGSLPRGGANFRINQYLQDQSNIEMITKHLSLLQQQVVQLSTTLHHIELDQETYSTSSLQKSSNNNNNNKWTPKSKFGLRKKKSKTSTSPKRSESGDQGHLIVSSNLMDSSHLSTSNPSLPTMVAKPSSLSIESEADLSSMSSREEFLIISKDIQTGIQALMKNLISEKNKMKLIFESESKSSTLQSNSVVASLRLQLNNCLQQNSELKAKLAKIHSDSDITGDYPSPTATRGIHQSLSYSSSGISEFFEARDYFSSDMELSMSEDEEEDDVDEEEGEVSEDDGSVEDVKIVDNFVSVVEDRFEDAGKVENLTGRRTKLIVPKPEIEGFNLWNLLCKNIGKDLSKISMPVTLNEPLGMLQRLCEELEYSDLLDKAIESKTSLERIQWVAAFAVSAYGLSVERLGHKPFNPLLGETYECVRDDRGFRFVAEQVSHHPPVSACHADGSNWVFKQELRIRTKFWGKSLEFQPEGQVLVELQTGDGQEKEVYTWNKITTCIHNLFSGSERWADLYGDLIIKSRDLTCKLTFVKAGYWSGKRGEIVGEIVDKHGTTIQHLFGKWNEALYCGKAPSVKCIWRPSALPEHSSLYYGFSSFAIELNELLEHEKVALPPTDTRFRTDQRSLEEGDIMMAETHKLRLEQMQRERAKAREDGGETYEPQWFTKHPSNSGAWKFNDKYWDFRNKTGFQDVNFVTLW